MKQHAYKEKLTRLFICIAGGIIFAEALHRLICIAVPKQLLAANDPIAGIPLRYTALIIGSIELLAALLCLFGRGFKLQAGLIVWLTANFGVYRGGLIWMNYHPRCGGWGLLTNPLQLPVSATDRILLVIMAGMLLGACFILITMWGVKVPVAVGEPLAARQLEDAKVQSLLTSAATGLEAQIKIPCDRCGGKIAFSAERIGQRIACPHCKAAITLRLLETIKTACNSCGGHLEFSNHALGQTIACPHCAASLVLCVPTKTPLLKK